MDPKRWSSRLPPAITGRLSTESSFIQNRFPDLDHVHDWPFASESTVGLPDDTGNVFAKDLRELKELDAVIATGTEWIFKLYGLRSISRAIPTSEEQKELVYAATFEMLLPLVKDMAEFQVFLDRVEEKICKSISYLNQPEVKKRTIPKAVQSRVIALIDVLMTLDSLKDIKTQIVNDFTSFKTAHTFLQKVGNEAAQRAPNLDFDKLRFFLVSKGNISTSLRAKLHATPGDTTETIQDLFVFALTELEANRFVHPEEKFRLIRYLPFAFFVIDHIGSEPNMRQCNAFKLKRMTEKRVTDIFCRYPVVPLFGDMHLTLIYILQRCPNFRTMTDVDINVVSTWGGVLPVEDAYSAAQAGSAASSERNKAEQINLEKLKRDKRNYELASHWRQVREEFDQFSARFQACARRVRTDALDLFSQEKRAFDAQSATYSPFTQDGPMENAEVRRRRLKSEQLDREAYEVCLEGLRLMGRWKELVWQQMAFKYSRGAADNSKEGSGKDFFSVYDSVIRLNHTPVDLIVLVDIVCTIKSLQSMMSQSADVMAMPIRRRIHYEIQEFSQLKLLRLCHAVHKKKKHNVLALLTQLRAICVDWTGMNPNDFKEKKLPRKFKEYEKKSGMASAQDDDEPPVIASVSSTVEDDRYLAGATRAVGPSPAQLTILRAFVETIRDPDKSEGFFEGVLEGLSALISSADLDRSQAEMLKDFYNRSFFYPYLLGMQTTVLDLGDMHFLWHREYYLEMSRQIQFPISSSLPWICLEQMLNNKINSGSMIDSVLFFLDIYNDALRFSLTTLKRKYLYDEVEAEAKLVFEQFVFLLADGLYTYYKNVNAGRLLDKSYKARMQELRKVKKQGKSLFSLPLIGGSSSGGGGGDTTYSAGRWRPQQFLETDHRRYSALLSARAFRFVGRQIDLPKLVCDQLNSYLLMDLELVFSRFEDMGLTSSKELESLIACLRGTHEDLTSTEKLDLDDFDLVIEQVDERLSSGLTPKTRLARFAEKELIYQIVSGFCYCAITERFVPAGVDGTAARKSKLQGPPNFLYGKTFKDTFAKAHSLESDFFSIGHLEAFLRSASVGSRSGHGISTIIIAYLTDSLVDRTKTIIKDLGELSKIYNTRLGGVPSSFHVKQFSSGSEAMRFFDTQAKQVVPHDDHRKKMLQLLRELGNALIVIKMLHGCLERIETRAFIQTSYVTGLDSFVPSGSDLVAPPSVEASLGVTRLPAQATKEVYDFLTDELSTSNELYRQPGLIRNAYKMLMDCVREVFVNSTESFVRIANYIQFSFASTSGGTSTAIPAQEDDETMLGEGELRALQFSLFSLGAVTKFESIDLCSHVARADALERCLKSDETSMKEPAASSNLNAFLRCVRDTIEPTKALVTSFLPVLFYESEYEVGNAHASQGKVKSKITLFHPPGNFFDEQTGEVRLQMFDASGRPQQQSMSSSSSSQQIFASSTSQQQSQQHRTSVSGPAPLPPTRNANGESLSSTAGYSSPFDSSSAPPPPARIISPPSGVGAPPPPHRHSVSSRSGGDGGPPPPPPRASISSSQNQAPLPPTRQNPPPPPPPPPPGPSASGAPPPLPPRDHPPVAASGADGIPVRPRRTTDSQAPGVSAPPRPPRSRTNES